MLEMSLLQYSWKKHKIVYQAYCHTHTSLACCNSCLHMLVSCLGDFCLYLLVLYFQFIQACCFEKRVPESVTVDEGPRQDYCYIGSPVHWYLIYTHDQLKGTKGSKSYQYSLTNHAPPLVVLAIFKAILMQLLSGCRLNETFLIGHPLQSSASALIGTSCFALHWHWLFINLPFTELESKQRTSVIAIL